MSTEQPNEKVQEKYEPTIYVKPKHKELPSNLGDFDISDYIYHRLENQRVWYEKKASESKKDFMRNQRWIIILGAVIPLLIALEAFLVKHFQSFQWMEGFSGFSSALIAAAISIIAALDKLNQPQTTWFNYRANEEALKKEQWMYMYQAGIYHGMDAKTAKRTLIERVETIISADIARFTKSENKGDGTTPDIPDALPPAVNNKTPEETTQKEDK